MVAWSNEWPLVLRRDPWLIAEPAPELDPESRACLRNEDDSCWEAVVAVTGFVEQLFDGTYCRLLLLLLVVWAVGCCEVVKDVRLSVCSCLGSESWDRDVSDSTKLSFKLSPMAGFEQLLLSRLLSMLGRG